MKHVFSDLFLYVSIPDFKCEVCILAKSHRVHYPLSMNKSNDPFILIHSDVWRPSPKSTIWFLMVCVFFYNCTRMTWIYLLKYKEELFRVFQVFHKMFQTQFFAKLQVLRSDNGGEYVNSIIQRILPTTWTNT